MPRHTLNVCGPQQFKARVPKFSGKSSEFSRYKHELINFARVEAIDWVFTMSGDHSHDVEVGNTEVSVNFLELRHGKGVVAANIRARQLLVASLDHKRDQDILFRIPSPAAVWRELNDFYCPKTNGAKLALLDLSLIHI